MLLTFSRFHHLSLLDVTGGESVAQTSPFVGHLHEAGVSSESAGWNPNIHSQTQTDGNEIFTHSSQIFHLH